MQFRFAVGEADRDAERLNYGGELAVEQRILHLQVGEEDERSGTETCVPEMDTVVAHFISPADSRIISRGMLAAFPH